MNINNVLPFLSSIIMIAFAVDVFRRYTRRPTHTHLLVWGIGLTMFGIGSVAEAISALVWSPIVFVCWYLFGAALNAGWIGQGTMYLLVRRNWVNVLTAIIVLGSLIAGALMLTTPLDASKFSTSLPLSEQYATKEYKQGDYIPAGRKVETIQYQGKNTQVIPGIMPLGAPVRLSTPIFNIYGLITLVGGALYSAFLFWRKRVLPNRVIGNVLIAAGALAIGSASTLTRLGIGSYLYLGELAAAILMYAGFILASQPAAVEPAAPAAQPASS